MRKRRLVIPGVVAGVLALMPSIARADSLGFSSSMSARCVATTGNPCSLVEFVLNVSDQTVGSTSYGDVWVNDVSINSTDPSRWAFNSVQRVWSESGDLYNPATSTMAWTVGYRSSGGLNIKAITGGGQEAVSPIYLLVAMDVFTTDPNGRDLSYAAGGYAYSADGQPVLTGTDFSTGGQVTPEPVSIVLLGTGLAGMAGAARRRKQKPVV